MNMKTITDYFSGTPEGKAIARQAETAQSAKLSVQRQAWGDDLAALDEVELIALRETHEPARAAALTRVLQCEAALHEAREQYTAVDRAASLVTWETDRERTRLQKALIESASPLIAVCERALRTDLEATYAQRDDVMGKNLDGRLVLAWSNRGSVERRVAAITAAIETVKKLVYEPLDDAALTARLEDVRTSLPALDLRPAKYRMQDPADEPDAREGHGYAYR
jgi:hypothetical protein